MRTDGTGTARLTTDRRYDSFWGRQSPDGARILFHRTPAGVHDRDYTKASLWMMNADGSHQRRLREAGRDGWKIFGHAEWSPDGTKLVMIGGASPQVVVTKTDGRTVLMSTSRPAMNLDPSWSPDGRTIVFASCSRLFCPEAEFEIFTMRYRPGATGRDARQITHDARRDHDPYFSPDGRRLAWLTQYSALTWDIQVSNASGSSARRLLGGSGITSKPEWSPDGTRLYFHRLDPEAGRFQLFSAKPDGSALQRLGGTSQPGASEYPSL